MRAGWETWLDKNNGARRHVRQDGAARVDDGSGEYFIQVGDTRVQCQPDLDVAMEQADALVGYPYALDGWDAHHDLNNVRVAFSCCYAPLAVWLEKAEDKHAMVRGGFEPSARAPAVSRRWWFGTAPAAQHSDCYLALAPDAAGVDRRVFSALGDRPTFESAIAAVLAEHRAGPPAMPGAFDRAWELLRDVPDVRMVLGDEPTGTAHGTRVDVELNAVHKKGGVMTYGVVTMEAEGPIAVGDMVRAIDDGRVRRLVPGTSAPLGKVLRVVGPK